MKKWIPILCIMTSTAFADTNSPTQPVQSTAVYMDLLAKESQARKDLIDALRVDANNHLGVTATSPDSVILKYAETLKSEAKDHREFVEGLYSKTAAALSGIFLLLGSMFVWMNWKTRSDVKKQVDDQFKQYAKLLIEEKINDFSRYLGERTKEIEKQMKGVNSLLFSIASQSTVPAAESSSFAKSSSFSGELRQKQVLWVDDFPGNNDYIRLVLEQQGVQFTLALSTEEGIKDLEQQKYDLVISDMGRGSDSQAGLHLLQQMRQKKISVPVIIFASRKAVNSYGEEAKRLGANYATSSVSTLLQGVGEILG